MPAILAALLLAGCASVQHIHPRAALCDVPSLLVQVPNPPPLPNWHVFKGGCWFVGMTAHT
jgi:hypothetical protein